MNCRTREFLVLTAIVLSSLFVAGQTATTSSSKPKSSTTQSSSSNAATAPGQGCVLMTGDGMGRRYYCTGTSAAGSSPSPTTSSTPAFQSSSGSAPAIQGLLNVMGGFISGVAASNTAEQQVANSRPCYWSSQWDQLAPEVQAGLRRPDKIDAVFTQLGGPSQVIAYTENPGNMQNEFASLKGQVIPDGDRQLHLIANGFEELAKCRLNQPAYSGVSKAAVVGADAFKKAGPDSIDNAMEDLLDKKDVNDCSAALQYVQDPNGLQNDLDVAIAEKRAHEEDLNFQRQLKADLLSDSWWATSKGPVVAARIKAVCDQMQDWLAVWNPEGAELSQGKDLALKGLKVAASMIKAAYENRESVTEAIKAAKDAEAKELADIAAEKLSDAIKMGPAYGIYKSLEDQKEYLKTLNEAAEARETVQGQLEKLDQQIAKAKNQVSLYQQKQTVLEALRSDVMAVCVQRPIDLPRR